MRLRSRVFYKVWKYNEKGLITIDIAIIKNLCNSNKLRWTQHVLIRLLQRNISTDDIVHALKTGEIIESYPNDYPYPSCLVLGVTINEQYLHIVCGLGESELWLITAYYPNSTEWESDLKTRKE